MSNFQSPLARNVPFNPQASMPEASPFCSAHAVTDMKFIRAILLCFLLSEHLFLSPSPLGISNLFFIRWISTGADLFPFGWNISQETWITMETEYCVSVFSLLRDKV